LAHGGAEISQHDVRDGSLSIDQRVTARGWYSYAARFRGEGTVARRAWRADYVRRILLADVMCAALAGAAGYFSRFGSDGETTPQASSWAALAMPLIWVGSMLLART
jgi:hypothetical protein